MIRESDFSHPNPPDDIPSQLMGQAMGAFMLPWPRKPLNGKAPGKGPSRQHKSKPSKSGLNAFKKRVSHPSPYF
jgi:hypothetical protein